MMLNQVPPGLAMSDRRQRIHGLVQRYQALVRSAVTLDALVD